ncbi:MAG TPA: hypothetical protein PLS59_09300, partial [Kiritimatiellia bacterium]|nr:hypothetical protein [Kiritimatiellia bacterium]
MKKRMGRLGMVAIALLVAGRLPLQAQTTYYVNDNSTQGDVYTTMVGNDANSGKSPSAPKLTLASVLTNVLMPGDKIYVDTGMYEPLEIPATVNGTPEDKIVFQGSTNEAAGGSVFAGDNTIVTIQGNDLAFRDMRVVGGGRGVELQNSANGEYEGIWIWGGSLNPVYISGAGTTSNVFRRCVFATAAIASAFNAQGGAHNTLENCVFYSPLATAFSSVGNAITKVSSSVAWVDRVVTDWANVPIAGDGNVLFGSSYTFGGVETLAGLQRVNTNWFGNTVADPKFVNPDAQDFHLLSAAGFMSNGVWVTNAAVGYSPAIDFGRRGDMAYTNEPMPNGGRVNVGLYGGTAEA